MLKIKQRNQERQLLLTQSWKSVTKWGATVKKSQIDSTPKFISHFVCTNNIFVDFL